MEFADDLGRDQPLLNREKKSVAERAESLCQHKQTTKWNHSVLPETKSLSLRPSLVVGSLWLAIRERTNDSGSAECCGSSAGSFPASAHHLFIPFGPISPLCIRQWLKRGIRITSS